MYNQQFGTDNSMKIDGLGSLSLSWIIGTRVFSGRSFDGATVGLKFHSAS